MVKRNLHAPGLLYIIRLFHKMNQLKIGYMIYFLFSILLIVDSIFLLNLSPLIIFLWSIYVLFGIWIIYYTATRKDTTILCLYLMSCFIWWSASILQSTSMNSSIFYFISILLMINVLSGSYLLNAFGAISYIITVILSFVLFPSIFVDSVDIFISMIVVNLLTIIVGFLTSYAVNHYDDSYTRWQKRALTDYLTGLLNREGFIQSFHGLPNKQGVFGIFDLNNFKQLNDNYGHEFGDNVLREIAKSFMETNETIYLGRIGGDEFVFHLPASQTNILSEKDTSSFIQKHIHKAGETLGISLTASVGSIIITEKSQDFRHLYRLTDEKMYEDKERLKHSSLG